jgi:DNA-damage-inducible protein J
VHYNAIHNTSTRNDIMAANALVQTRVDGAVKEEAAAVLATMGLTVSDAVRLLLTRIAHDHALPFDPLIPNPETIEAMQEARRGNLSSAASVEQFLDAMHAED